MRKILYLFFFISQVHAVTVLSEKNWCTGSETCHGNIWSAPPHASPKNFDTARSGVVLLDQFGFQGLELMVYSTHTFYVYNTGGYLNHYTLKAKLCDMRNICSNFEKEIKIDWKQFYSETIYLSLSIASQNIGREPLTADTGIIRYPGDYKHIEASLLLSPFPYD